MATVIFTDISDFKLHVGGGVNMSLEMDSLKPHIEMAADKHLVPWLGDAQWDKILTDIDALNTEEEALLPYLQRTLALLTMYEYSNIGSIQMGEAGLMRAETDEMKGAYKYQENNYKDYMLATGYASLERLLKFLEANAGDYPLWTTSAENKRNRAYFINYAQEMQLIYSINVNRYVFDVMRPAMSDVETFAIIPLIGETFYDELKTAIDNKTVDADQLAAIALIQKAVAHFTVEEGIRRSIVQHKGDRIIIAERLEPQSSSIEGAPAAQMLRQAIRQAEEFGNRHISVLKKFLNDNLETYTAYSAYLDELAAAAAAEEETTDERCECGCCDACSWRTRKSTISAIIKL